MSDQNTEKSVPLPPQMSHQISKNGDVMNEEEAKKAAAAAEAAAKSQTGSGVTEEELSKSLDQIEAMLETSPDGRKKKLFEKGMKSGLSTEENAELMQLMSGVQPGRQTLTQTIDKSLDVSSQSEGFKKALNVSDYLDDLHGSMTGALRDVADHVEKSEARTQERTLVLAKALLDVGRVEAENHKMLKSISERLGLIERQPARPPKAAQNTGGAQALEKSFAGQPPAGERISKAQALDLMNEMFEKSMARGESGIAKCGEQIDLAATNYESFGVLSDAMRQEVLAYHKSRLANGHAR